MRKVFNVFGRIIAVERQESSWSTWLLGSDGKRQPLELAVPSDVMAHELAQYLYDIYHEDATPSHGEVIEVLR
ncbi:MAG: hypothetical protein EOO31_10775 [Comamonadaceae bacterium]|nr:MAG: hypothetical protein EOO31_10775 [Comamonadaceae bacterium]